MASVAQVIALQPFDQLVGVTAALEPGEPEKNASVIHA